MHCYEFFLAQEKKIKVRESVQPNPTEYENILLFPSRGLVAVQLVHNCRRLYIQIKYLRRFILSVRKPFYCKFAIKSNSDLVT